VEWEQLIIALALLILKKKDIWFFKRAMMAA
jgi:hypothetical protein